MRFVFISTFTSMTANSMEQCNAVLCFIISGSKTKKIPYPTKNPFTWIFWLVSCPNYTYEVSRFLLLHDFLKEKEAQLVLKSVPMKVILKKCLASQSFEWAIQRVSVFVTLEKWQKIQFNDLYTCHIKGYLYKFSSLSWTNSQVPIWNRFFCYCSSCSSCFSKRFLRNVLPLYVMGNKKPQSSSGAKMCSKVYMKLICSFSSLT